MMININPPDDSENLSKEDIARIYRQKYAKNSLSRRVGILTRKVFRDLRIFYRARNSLNNQNLTKRLKSLEKKFIRVTRQAYPHLLRRNDLKTDRHSLRKGNPALFDITITMTEIFQSLSPFVGFFATFLLLQSFGISLIVIAIGLLLAILRPTSKGGEAEQFNLAELFQNKKIKPWLFIVVVYAILAPVFGVIAIGINTQFIELLTLTSIVSLLIVCLSGKSWIKVISLVWLLLRDWWLGIRIVSENFASNRPRHIYIAETAVREHLNILLTHSIPLRAFSIATTTVLEEWLGINPYPTEDSPDLQKQGVQPEPHSNEPEDINAANAAYEEDTINQNMRTDEGQV
jgi:hypothetical protein